MPNRAFDRPHLFTYGDYVKWPEEERWELIDGIAYNMTPAPSDLHQFLSAELMLQIGLFLRGKQCRVVSAPFDVRLPNAKEADDEVCTVVQPDILVVCDRSKIDKHGCRGAPDFIIEIISPSTGRKDQTVKTVLYEKHGVREYWILHPLDGLLTIRTLGEDGRYPAPRVVELKGTIAVETLPGLEINLDAVGALCDEAADLPDEKSTIRERRI